MEVVTGAMGSLLPKLSELLKQENYLQKGVKKKIQKLLRELEMAQAVLCKIGDVPPDQVDAVVKLWARDVREASYDMEDAVDAFLVRVVDGPDQEPGKLDRLLWKMVGSLFKSKARHKISSLIDDISEKLEMVQARRGRFTPDGIFAMPAAAKTIDPRVLNLYKRASEVVGMDGPRDELINMLSLGGSDGYASADKMKIVAIVGFGGLGKTALAKTVYDQLKPRFQCRAFVPVGQNPDMNEVLRDFLIGLDYQKYTYSKLNGLDEKQLMDELIEFIKEKRCFIVIDDIWDKGSWDLIRCALQGSNCASRFIITTRNFEVATRADEVYEILPLSRDNSEKLLFARISDGEGKDFDRPSVGACEKILKKCSGVPLAIITIASLLANKPREDWSEIYNSIGFGHEDNNDVNNTRRILSLSYYDLPSHLKACLLYLSVFPKDDVIEKNSLIWKWIAEGFIPMEQAAKAGVGLFELGERCFNELINRSMIQAQERGHEGYIDACSVHDMVLDLIHQLSREENFVTVLSGGERQKLQVGISRRLALLHVEEHNADQLANTDVEKVRSLFACRCDFAALCPRLPFLRVVDMVECSVSKGYHKVMLDHLGSLLHLRYLGLAVGESMIELPREVKYLRFLQTLDLWDSWRIKKLPKEVGLLTQLVCLRTRLDIGVPAGLIGKLRSLQELVIGCPIGEDETMQFVKELGMLRELRVLRTSIFVTSESTESALLESLGYLHNIQELSIEGSSRNRYNSRKSGAAGIEPAGVDQVIALSNRHLRFLSLHCLVFSKLPASSSLSPNLSYLHVRFLVVRDLDIDILARLPELRHLTLYVYDTKVVSLKIGTAGDGYFRKLRFLNMFFPSVFIDLHGSGGGSVPSNNIMPCLEFLGFDVYVQSKKYENLHHGFDKLFGFHNLGTSSLQRVYTRLYCKGALLHEMEEAEAALQHAAAVHPKQPTLRMERLQIDDMMSRYQEDLRGGELGEQQQYDDILHSQAGVPEEQPGELFELGWGSIDDDDEGGASASAILHSQEGVPEEQPGELLDRGSIDDDDEDGASASAILHSQEGVPEEQPGELLDRGSIDDDDEDGASASAILHSQEGVPEEQPGKLIDQGSIDDDDDEDGASASAILHSQAGVPFGQLSSSKSKLQAADLEPPSQQESWAGKAPCPPSGLALGAATAITAPCRDAEVADDVSVCGAASGFPSDGGKIDGSIPVPATPAQDSDAVETVAADGAVNEQPCYMDSSGSRMPSNSTRQGEMSSTLSIIECPTSSSLGAMGPLLRKLDSLLSSEKQLRRSVKEAIKLLKEDLEEINADLLRLSMIERPNYKIRYWIHEVRELSYTIEDCIDNMMQSRTTAEAKVRFSGRRPQLRFRRHVKIPWLPKTVLPSARIAELRTLLWEASERHERYHLQDCVSEPSRFLFSGNSSVPASSGAAANLVGVDATRGKLTSWLHIDQTEAEQQQQKVLSILGPSGVGKTALVRELYREFGHQFECLAFVRVSRNPDIKRLLGEILSQLQGRKRDYNACTVDNLLDTIRSHLLDKRYFVVIDELWKAAVWDIINIAFPKGNNCSRIIITAEGKDVKYYCVNTLEMTPLASLQDSGKIFFDRVFGSEHQCPDQLMDISCTIIRSCGGFPLAMTTIASLLANQIHNTELWNYIQQCFLSRLTCLTLEETCKEVVNICYDALPQDLKTCLLYLAMYPEGCRIRKVDLLNQWIAEGFISPKEGEQAVAESYFAELIKRGIIQPEKIDHNDEVLSCTVHHIILDLIVKRSREENFITVVDYSQPMPGFSMTTRRLSLHFSCAQFADKPEGINLSQVRSLAFYGLLKCMPSITEFKFVRILILEFWGHDSDHKSLDLSKLFMLFQLRYLKIISSHIVILLPFQMQRLQSLEILEIDAQVSLLLPSKALSDRHLKRNLVVLSSSLGRLPNLKSLRLGPCTVGMTMFIDHDGISCTPQLLERLDILQSGCIFNRVPTWIVGLTKLRILKIAVKVLLSSDIDNLTGLPALAVLSLYVQKPDNAEDVVFNSGALPALKYFKYKCGALRLAFQKEALPNLQRLKLCFNVHRAESHTSRIAGIEHLLKLKEISAEIGAASGADESDRSAAESALQEATKKHPRSPIHMNVKRVDCIEEESMPVGFMHHIHYILGFLVLAVVVLIMFFSFWY